MVREFDFVELDELYRETILDHYRNPRNRTSLSNADIYAKGNIPFCGDEVTIQIKLNDEGLVHDIGFSGQGCSISQASASIMTERLKGKTVEQVEVLTELFNRMMLGKELSRHEQEELRDLKAMLGVRKFPIRIKCALLAWSAVKEGIRDHRAGETSRPLCKVPLS